MDTLVMTLLSKHYKIITVIGCDQRLHQYILSKLWLLWYYERKKYQKLYKRFTVDRTVRVTISICTDKPARLDSLSAALTCTWSYLLRGIWGVYVGFSARLLQSIILCIEDFSLLSAYHRNVSNPTQSFGWRRLIVWSTSEPQRKWSFKSASEEKEKCFTMSYELPAHEQGETTMTTFSVMASVNIAGLGIVWSLRLCVSHHLCHSYHAFSLSHRAIYTLDRISENRIHRLGYESNL